MGEGAPAGVSAPWRPPASPPLAWPDTFGTRYTIFVDTEEEFDWTAPLSRDARAVTATAAIPKAHARFADRGAALTFLVDHPIASDPGAVTAIMAALADGRSAVGTQLHPWVNPPHDETVSRANSYAGNLPEALEAAKLDALTMLITTAFGQRPSVYRAGRYGVGPNTWRLLAERGYRLDTSLRARYDYRADGGPDFSGIGNHAFRTAEGLVELPLTSVFTGRLRSPALYDWLGKFPRGRGVAARTGMVQRIALTPEQMPLHDALEAVRIAHGEGLRLLNFAFHSPSLAPGHTPYVRDAADLAAFWRWWTEMLDHLDQLGIANASLGEIMAAVVGPAGLEPATKPL